MSKTNNGISQILSVHPVRDVLARLLSLLRTKEITVFAVVDHSGEAVRAGFEMQDTKLVIFGNPRAGTPVMLAEPDSALDLPLKILIAEISDGSTRISYNSPAYLQSRYGLEPALMKPLAAVEQIADAIARLKGSRSKCGLPAEKCGVNPVVPGMFSPRGRPLTFRVRGIDLIGERHLL